MLIPFRMNAEQRRAAVDRFLREDRATAYLRRTRPRRMVRRLLRAAGDLALGLLLFLPLTTAWVFVLWLASA